MGNVVVGQTFFGFFVSGGVAESCDGAGGAGAVLS
jgi:hypothetical protein